ncbi:MAG: sulfatase [Thermogutta sp.]
MIRRSLLLGGILGLLLVCRVNNCAAEGGLPSPPNVLFILADDLGWRDLGIYGSTYHETPNLDRLARRGLRFTQAYAANPLCSPTRASILTGLHPARIGITAPGCHLKEVVLEKGLVPAQPRTRVRTANSLTRLKPEYVTLAEVFQQHGYVTAHFGKWHLGHGGPYEPKDQGFMFDFPHTPAAAGPGGGYLAPWKFISDPNIQGEPGEHIEDRMSQEAARFIRENRDRAFFLNYWCYSVHGPWSAKPELVEYFKEKAKDDAPQRNPVYAAMVKSMDDAVGRLLEAVDQAGIADRTIIVFFSDNGGFAYPPRNETQPPGYATIPATSNLPLRSGKASIYEGGTREPLIVVWPGHTQPNSVTEALFSSIDFFPTILEMCGLPMPAQPVDGVSQVPTILGKGPVRTQVFCHFPHGSENQAQQIPGFLPSAYVRDGDWKLIRFFSGNPDGTDRFELYNLREDLGETYDLAAERPEVVAKLAAELGKFLKDTEAVIPEANPNYQPAAAADPLMGWKARGCEASVESGVLKLRAQSETPFLGFSVGKQAGPMRVTFRLQLPRAGEGQIEWIPPDGAQGQSRSVPYTVTETGMTSVTVNVPWEKPIGILRIYLPKGTPTAEVGWIELETAGSKRRFDF